MVEPTAFVCPWCALSFVTKSALSRHWMTSPICARNRMVSNQTQSKYGSADAIGVTPGEATLHRVRGPTCQHSRKATLYGSDGAGGWADEVVGIQCLDCYEVWPADG